MKPKSLWVWWLNHNEISKLRDFCDKEYITKIYINHELYEKYNYSVNAVFVPLIGCIDKDKTAKDIIVPLDAKIVHLDIELAEGETREHFNKKLEKVIDYYKSKGFRVELDVETWNKDPNYIRIIHKADEWALMSYHRSWFRTLLKSIWYINKPYWVGVETDPKFEHVVLQDRENSINKINFLSKLFKNYKGVALHHWGTLK
jgi:hypothetical protein